MWKTGRNRATRGFANGLRMDRPTRSLTLNCATCEKALGFFRLVPESGRKHQLRVHMASIGFPIVGDPFYPQIRERQSGDPPLQLLARRLAFTDPLSGVLRSFTSVRRLRWFPADTEDCGNIQHL